MTSYDPAHFAPLFAIEDRHFWFRARNAVLLDQFMRLHANLPPRFRALEIGCGTGYVLRALEDASYGNGWVGMDLFAEGLAFARRRVQCPLLVAALHAPPFGEAFDFVGAFDVIEHLPDDVGALRDLGRVLRPGGYLCLTVPARRSLWSYFDEAAHHCRRYEKDELQKKIEMSGFRVERLMFFMGSLYPMVWLGRRIAALLHKAGGKELDRAGDLLQQELRITSIANGLLGAALRLETEFLARDVALPVGTSLLVIARKIESNTDNPR